MWKLLTGRDAVISNYPGTTVEPVRGYYRNANVSVELIDTPGIYSMDNTQGPEQLTCRILLEKTVDAIVNVVDAADLARQLTLTLELQTLGLPMVVVLNQIDRAREQGNYIDDQELARWLGIPVISLSALTGEGINELRKWLETGGQDQKNSRKWMQDSACDGICSMCLKGDLCGECPEQGIVSRVAKARNLADKVTRRQGSVTKHELAGLEAALDHPLLGPLLLFLLTVVFLQALIVTAGTAEHLIDSLFVPVQAWMSTWIRTVISDPFWSRVLAQGIPEGLLVPFALVMPAMLVVSALMSVIEDTGLLPRYALALEKLGGLMGVSGEAFIPLSLGFGCRTPAVVATRLLNSQSQRFIIVALLSIVIPCASTTGILVSVISAFHASGFTVVLAMLAAFIGLGWLLRALYGEKEEILYELPPLRIPRWGNVMTKTRMRFAGFFTEVLPILVIMSVAVRVVLDSGWLTELHHLEPVARTLFGIPAEALIAVIITITQRYLAPLVLLNLSLTPREATIAISMIALSLPCFPVIVMTVRELGIKPVLKIIGLGLAVSAMVGMILNLLLPA